MNRFQKQNRVRRHGAARRGAAAVEFAIVAPVFLLLVLGSIDMCRLLMAQSVLTNASREACRVAILQDSTTAEVKEIAQRFSAAGMIANPTTTINNQAGNAGGGDLVSVTVSAPFRNVTWTGILLFVGEREVSGVTIMRRESF